MIYIRINFGFRYLDIASFSVIDPTVEYYMLRPSNDNVSHLLQDAVEEMEDMEHKRAIHVLLGTVTSIMREFYCWLNRCL